MYDSVKKRIANLKSLFKTRSDIRLLSSSQKMHSLGLFNFRFPHNSSATEISSTAVPKSWTILKYNQPFYLFSSSSSSSVAAVAQH